jgi:hypothetical protein
VEVDVAAGVQGAAEPLCRVRQVLPGGEVACGPQRRRELIERGGRVWAARARVARVAAEVVNRPDPAVRRRTVSDRPGRLPALRLAGSGHEQALAAGVGEPGEFELIGGRTRTGDRPWLGQDQPDP